MLRKLITKSLTLLIILVVSSAVLQAELVWAEQIPVDAKLAKVQVTETFVEWRSGPAEGFPVFHVSERGEWLSLIRRKTDWMKVSDKSGRDGWIKMADLLLMIDGSGEKVNIVEPQFDDFNTRRWEAGLMSGEFENAAVNSAYAGYWMTENLSLELWGSQVLGDASEIKIINLNILHQPFPDWRVSPFFTLGAGMLFINPKATLADQNNRDEETMNAGFGLRYYVSNRYFVRMEVKEYKVFTNRETNEEATEWKIGLSVFF